MLELFKKCIIMKSLFVIFFFFFVSSLLATTYYVDYSSGNDSNSGTSEADAWKTLSKIENSNFLPGDSILLKRGEVWHERLYISSSGNSGNPIYIGPYGTGAKPQINILNDYTLTWIHDSGNIWYNTQFNDNPKRLLKDGVELLDAAKNYFDELGTNIPDLVEWYWGKKDSNDNQDKLYLYSVDDPNTHSFTLTTTAYALELFDKHYLDFSDLEFVGASLACITIYSCSYIHLTNLDVGKYANYGIEMTCYKPNGTNWQKNEFIVIDNCTIDSYYTFDYSNAGTQSGKSNRGSREGVLFRRNTRNCELKNSLIKNYCHANINIFAPIDNGQPVEEQEVKDNSIHHNTITSPDLAYGGRVAIDGYCHHNEIFDNVIKNTSVQSQINGHENHVHHNIFKNTLNSPLKDWKVGHAISLQGYYSEVFGNIIENNLMIDCDAAGIFLSGNNSEGDVDDNYFRNNIIYNCGIDYSNRGIGIESDFNTYSNDGNHFLNNLVFCSSTTQTIYFYGSTYDVGGFNGQNGTHNHEIVDNIVDDPLFVDVNNEDYHIPDNSPCVDAAIIPLATEDYEGNEIPHGQAADIGIYENQYQLALNKIISFNAIREGEKVNLRWELTDEATKEFNSMVLLRSYNGLNWQNIKEQSINTTINSYKYLDSPAKEKNVYYKIKISSLDGSFVFSDIIQIRLNINDEIIVYPNPGKYIFHLDILDHKLKAVKINILDNTGRIVKVFNFDNSNKINLDLTNLSKGIYFLQIFRNNKIDIKKLRKY